MADKLQAQKEGVSARFFCATCSALRADNDAQCADCGHNRPDKGWSELEQAFDPFLGRILQDRYLIDKIEGRGASSTVYRARSLNIPKRFAVKMVRLAYSERAMAEQARSRLEREVRAVGMLRSPHIVRVYEMIEVDSNWVAVVMEHIDGQTVEERVEQHGPIELDEVCRLLLQVANGLCEAHQNGMVHRDIKPANLMLEKLPDGSDFAYLLDFGVVRLQDESGMTQGFLGTPLFTSPEQAGAEIRPPTRAHSGTEAPSEPEPTEETTVDARTDIYSLGATFYFMLTGHAPFESSDTVEVLRSHLQRRAPTLSQRCPERDFPAGIENLIAAMLAKSPDERPANVFRVIDAIQEYSEGHFAPPGGLLSSSPQLEPNTDPIELTTAVRSPTNNPPSSNPPARKRYDSAHMLSEPPTSKSDAHSFLSNDRPRIQTEPGGTQRPQTNPRGLASSTLERLEQRTQNGQRFARNIRASGVASPGFVGFVDSHNEVWTLRDTELTPHCTPTGRVCSLTTSKDSVFVGLKDASVHRVRPDSRELDQLLPTQRIAASASVDALCTTPGGDLLLAGTSGSVLFIGRRTHDAASAGFAWQTLHASHPIAALAITRRGDVFAAASSDHCVRIATPNEPDAALTHFATDAPIVDMAFSTDGDLLAVLLQGTPEMGARVQVYQVLCSRKISEFSVSAPLPRNLYFSAHNMLHGVCAAHGRIGSWNLMADRTHQPQ